MAECAMTLAGLHTTALWFAVGVATGWALHALAHWMST